ncbi:MAG: glycosyltransferase family 2 protein, partial [Hyphomonadaceae bacterium]
HSPRWLFFYPGLILMVLGVFVAGVLAPGAVRVTPTLELDFHTLIAACFAVIVGSQLLMFGFVARRYAMMEGFLPSKHTLHGLLEGLTLERILQSAGVLLAIGIGGVIWSLWFWASLGFGAIEYPLVLRVLVIALSAVVVAVQMAASAFLVSVFSLRA